LTWVIGRESYHIGASGVIYLLFGFLSLKGLVSRHFRLLALSFFVVFMYGSMVWYIAPIEQKISWEGHLSGLLVGIAFAFIFRKKIAEKPKYVWESPYLKLDKTNISLRGYLISKFYYPLKVPLKFFWYSAN